MARTFLDLGKRYAAKLIAPAAIAVVFCACDPAPVAGDGKCELTKGEHDVASPTWDPKDCGYCGDLIAQPWENEIDCPVDFHCGNGKKDHGKIYGAIVKTKTDGGTSYSLSNITLYECNEADPTSCPGDCNQKSPKSKTDPRCPSAKTQIIKDMHQLVVDSAKAYFNKICGAGATGEIDATFMLTANPSDGKIKLNEVTGPLSCYCDKEPLQGPCKELGKRAVFSLDKNTVVQATGFNVDGRDLGSVGITCNYDLSSRFRSTIEQ